MAKKSLTEQVTEKFDSKKFKEEFKKKFTKITHTPPPEIDEDTTPQIHDWTQRKPPNKESQSRPTSPKHSYILRQQKLAEEKKKSEEYNTKDKFLLISPSIAQEIKEMFEDKSPKKIKNYTAKKKQLKQWLEQAEKLNLEAEAETYNDHNENSTKPLIGENPESLYT